MSEKLSAFIDAELSEHEEHQVLQTLQRDDKLRGTWERYHLIRAAMTRQLEAVAPAGFVDGVLAQLDEPEETNRRLRFGPLAAGFALAASVATVSIVSLQSFLNTATPVVAVNNVKNTETQTVATVSAPTVTAIAPTATSVVPSDGERFNAYIVGHSEFVSTEGMGGIWPYARVVTHDVDGNLPDK
ncbi:MAG: hypothetical protein HY308_09955 [Gammaproteobacteria bacterium]|nr:hypothetical protein [Gammaproteobacteria bacterium]